MSFQFDFTKEHAHEILHNNPNADDWYDALMAILPKYEITSPLRVAAFMAQCLGFDTACLDVHNLKRFGIKNTWRG